VCHLCIANETERERGDIDLLRYIDWDTHIERYILDFISLTTKKLPTIYLLGAFNQSVATAECATCSRAPRCVHRAVCTVHPAVCTMHCAPRSVHCTVGTMHHAVSSVRTGQCAQHSVHWIWLDELPTMTCHYFGYNTGQEAVNLKVLYLYNLRHTILISEILYTIFHHIYCTPCKWCYTVLLRCEQNLLWWDTLEDITDALEENYTGRRFLLFLLIPFSSATIIPPPDAPHTVSIF